MFKPGSEGLPSAIAAEQLQAMLNANPAFCSWDPTYAKTRDLLTGWPYLFSQPLSVTTQRLATN
jgi:hypothetical protein